MNDRTIEIRAAFQDEVTRELRRLRSEVKSTSDKLDTVGKGAKSAGAGMSLLAGAAGGAAVMLGTKLIGAAVGVGKAFMSAASEAETLTLQFKTLLGSQEAATRRMRELQDVAAKTPFQLTELANASRVLETLTKGALSTRDGLTMVGDTAAATGTDFQNLAMHVGRAYDGLQSNRPIGEALMRLQELGIVSGETRGEIESLQKAGKGKEAWKVLEAQLKNNSGAMEDLSGTWAGLNSTLQDTFDEIARQVMQGGALDGLKNGLSSVLDTMNELIDSGVFEDMGEQIGTLTLRITDAVDWFGDLVVGAKEYFGIVNQNDEALKSQIASMREQIAVDTERLGVLKEQIATQNALKAAGGSAFQPSKLQAAKNEMSWIKALIKESNVEMQKLLGTYTGDISSDTGGGKPTGGKPTGGTGGSAAPKKQDFSVLDDYNKAMYESAERAFKRRIAKQEEYNETVKELEEAHLQIGMGAKQKELEALQQWYNEKLEIVEGNTQAELHVQEIAEARKAAIYEKYKEEKKLSMQDWADAAISSASQVSNAVFSIHQSRLQKEKSLNTERIRNSTKSEEEKQKEIEKIEREAFQRNKRASVLQILIDGAVGAIKTIANVGFPMAAPLLVIQGAATAAALATVAAQKFADGGIVDGPSSGDSTLIRANGGELMLNKRHQTNLLNAINSGRMGGGVNQNINFGAIVVQGNATPETVQRIRKAQSDQATEVHDMMKRYKHVYGTAALI